MARRSVTIVVPMVPDAKLSPNSRVDRRYSTAERSGFRAAAKLAAVSEIARIPDRPVFSGPVRVYPVIAWSKGRRYLDGDNALFVLKAMWDGFTDAGLWGDDRHCVFHPVAQERDGSGLGYVTVVIEELSGDDIIRGVARCS